MKRITLPILALLVLGTGFAYAQANHEKADLTNCFFTLWPDKKVETCNWTWFFETRIDLDEVVTIEPFLDESYDDFQLRLAERIAVITATPPPEPTEDEKRQAEIMKIVEAARKEVSDEEKRLSELKILCGYGEDGWKVIQKSEVFDSIERLFQKVGSKEYKKLKLNQAFETCRGMNNYKADLRQWEDYPAVDEPKSKYETDATVYQVLNTVADKETWNTRNLQEHDFIKALETALETQCSVKGKQRGLCITDPTGKLYTHPAPTKDCQFNPITQRIDLCPEQALEDYNNQEIRDYSTATKILCEAAYKETWRGTTTKTWWPDLLVDGTCDLHVAELVEKRGDYVREQWKGQTVQNCPDCARFK